MGNRLTVIDIEDAQIADDVKVFFTRIRIKWVEYFISQLKHVESINNFDVKDHETRISWKNYFKLFADVKKFMEIEDQINDRLIFHIACQGYVMTRGEYEEPRIVEIQGIPDDYTEDEASDSSDDENQN
eukprot:gene16118-33828_t